jgi:RNA polymerase sigma-70 factor (ECF subfamily)
LRYRDGVGVTPSQPAATLSKSDILPASRHLSSIESSLLEELWQLCDAASYGLTRNQFTEIALDIEMERNFGQPPGTIASPERQAIFFRSLKLPDLMLARACARGNELAWRHFLALFEQPLIRAAIAITGNETQGRDLADALYAELYGLTSREIERSGEKDGSAEPAEVKRLCPLNSYQGRGSLIGWLRTILAQRHVDHHRRTWREQPLSAFSEDVASQFESPTLGSSPASTLIELNLLSQTVEEALSQLPAEDRFLLASYYLDGRTLLQIARLLHVHEATVSRKLHRLTGELRKHVLRNLQKAGLSKRAAQEALGTDPRDLDLNFKKLLQTSPSESFSEKAGL